MNTAVVSITKPFTITSTQIPSSARHRRHLRSFTLASIKNSSSSDSNNGGNASPPVSPPPDAVGIRFRRGSRRRSRQLQKEQDGGATNGLPKKAEPKKDWESMTITEKAVEVYVGEKGLLFWLNKFAYASIFIIIGAWILFRFVGPALNLYQLDSTPLPPTSMFKGS